MVSEKQRVDSFYEIPKYKEFRKEAFSRREEGSLRYLVFFGGRGSGKSRQVAELLTQLIFNRRDRIVIFRKFESTNKDSTYSELISHLKKKRGGKGLRINPRTYRVLKSPKSIETTNVTGKKGHAIWKGLAFSHRIKSIHKADTVFIEEADELTYQDFLDLDQSVRSPKAIIILVFNPPDEGEDHWIYKHFFSPKGKEVNSNKTMILHTTYKDNPYLDPLAVQSYESLKNIDTYQYERAILGLWTKNLEALVFPNFETVKGNFIPPSSSTILQGLDFGFTNATAFVRVFFFRDKEGKETIYVAKEKYKSGLDTSSMISYLSEWHFVKSYPTFADSEDPSRIQDLKKSGFHVQGVSKPAGSVLQGISYIKTRNLIVHESCTNLIRELKNYSWRKNKNGSFDYGIIANGC